VHIYLADSGLHVFKGRVLTVVHSVLIAYELKLCVT